MVSRIKEMFSSREEQLYDNNYQGQQLARTNHGTVPILELRVPMCCEKCQEKVKEELEELPGVRDVVCDQYNQRVTVTGHVDPLQALKKVKKVKKKSEFFNRNSYISNSTVASSHGINQHADVRYTGNPLVHSNYDGRSSRGQIPLGRSNSFGRPLSYHPDQALTRSNSYGRRLGRQPSFGRVLRHDGARHREFEPLDIQRDYYGVRRMPSFKNHRYHDAEYISMGDQYTPSYGDTHYVSSRNMRPNMFRSQVSFSKLPVTNPRYVKHIDSEYL